MLFFMGYLPLLNNTYALLQFMTDSTVCHVTQGMDDIFYLTEVIFCPQSHTDSPIMMASVIGQESVYTCKL
jgi:hypothetical protein